MRNAKIILYSSDVYSFASQLINKTTFKVHAHQKEEKNTANAYDDIFN